MQTQNINVFFDGQQMIGFTFQELPIAAAQLVACQQIDQAADAARIAVLGDTLRALEYQTAAQEAQAFADAGYAGDAPPTVQAWMDAADLTPQAAADSILAKAGAWKTALYAIRTVRLVGKQKVLKASTHDLAETIADEAIAKISESVSDASKIE